MKTSFEPNNGIKAYQDFAYYYDSVPHDIEFEINVKPNIHYRFIDLIADGFGSLKPGEKYGGGGLIVRNPPEWLCEKLNIKMDRRKGERRGRK